MHCTLHQCDPLGVELLVVSLIDVSCTKFHQATAGAALVHSPDANAALDQSVITIRGLSPDLLIIYDAYI